MEKSLKPNGFSLIQVIIGIGLTSVLGLAIMRMSQNSSQMQAGMRASAEFIEITNIIQSKFHKRDYCKASFADFKDPTDPTIQLLALANRPYSLTPNADPTQETVVPITELGKPQYLIDAVTGLKTIDSIVEEYVIPDDVDVVTPDPLTGLQYGGISLMSMNLIRTPGGDDVFLELNFIRRNAKSFGGRDLTKRIPLQVVFAADGVTILDCYSDFENLAETAVQRACEDSLLGTYTNDGDASTPDCINTAMEKQICENQKNIIKLMGNDFNGTICGFNFSVTDGGPGILTSGASHTLPANFVPGTLQVALLGAGGGGGCSGQGSDANARGQGGRRGTINRPGIDSKYVLAGTTISYTLGGGGSNGFCDNGGPGGNTTMSFSSFSFSAQGGNGGAKKYGGDKPGQSVTFMGSTFSGGTPGNESEGGNGSTGAGGGGGDQKPVYDRKKGGKGGNGAVYIQYKVWTDATPAP